MITDRDVASYRDNGWLVVDDVFNRTELDRARSIIEEKVQQARGVSAHTDLYDLEPDHGPDVPRVRRIKTPHRHIPYFMDLARSPNLIQILQQLLGTENVRLHGSKINMKSPRGGSPVEWHQDWAFYPHTNDDILAVGVMLEDCTVENGAMLMVPGSHRGPVHDHHADGCFSGAMNPAEVDLASAVPCVGRAGSVSFHHVRTVHGSAENLSDKPRTLLLYEFAAADAWPLLGVSDLADFDARLVSGRPTAMPRMRDLPVRIPLPPSPKQGSIYETQLSAKNRYFGRRTAA
ncbi:MAG TPA: phytanoyl-CoA dioxygenase family protein [Acetobacteraceae bacterium]|jgi:ectoine hydroxylase-related dioxygenase (phytanoyl-CoA dioxygenase family)|nr:phytanoyl-CoA dioxygenase family protein [Acetobacteraceae bacterium]